jgi:hypothetical protein
MKDVAWNDSKRRNKRRLRHQHSGGHPDANQDVPNVPVVIRPGHLFRRGNTAAVTTTSIVAVRR